MLRRLARLVAAVGIVWMLPVHALGLGEIDVRSKLNQKFTASIPVIDSAPQELDSLQVVMANPADFDRAGIERTDYLSSITLKLETGASGTRVLVSSTKIAHEPFLNFLVEAHWQGGRLLREYTVLLDPPNLASGQTTSQSGAPTAPVSADVAAAPAIAAMPDAVPAAEAPMPEAAPAMPAASAPEPASESVQPAAERPTAASPRKDFKKTTEKDKAPTTPAEATPFASKTATEVSAGAKTYGPVDPSETLWGIAGRVRPEAASTDQTLLALGLANPEAFDHGLFNGLLKGVTLKVPSDAEIESVPPEVAKERIAQWRKGGKLASESPKAPAAAVAAPLAKPVHAAAKAPEPSPLAARPVMPSAPSPRSKPAMASLDSAAKPSTSVTASPLPTGPVPAPSVAAPTPSSSLVPAPAATAPAVATTSAATPAATGATASGTSPSSPSPSPVAASTTAAASATAPVSSPAATPEQPAAPAPTSTTGGETAGSTSGSAAPAPVKATSSGDSSAGLWILLLLAALIGFLVWRSQKRAKALRSSPAPSPMTTTFPVPPAPKPAAPVPPSSPAATSTIEPGRSQAATAATVKPPVETRPFDDADPVFEPITSAAPAKPSERVVAPAPGIAKIDSQLGLSDPISEADFHLAYGLHDEAANLLRRSIESEPSRKDLRVKLAEVYFAASKAAEFQQTAVPLRGQIPAADWQKLAALGRQITPDVAAFREDADAPTAETAPPRAPSPVSAPAFSSNLLDFNFDEPAKPAPGSSPQPAKGNNLLDFDFDAELANLQPKSLNESMGSAPDLSPGEFDLSQEMQELQDSKPAATSAAPAAGEVDLSQSFPETPLSADDEIGTKLDLARAYADMGDNEAATELLREVALAGNAAQMQEAEALAKRLRSA